MPPFLTSEAGLALLVAGIAVVLASLRVLAAWVGREIEVHDLAAEARRIVIAEARRLMLLRAGGVELGRIAPAAEPEPREAADAPHASEDAQPERAKAA